MDRQKIEFLILVTQNNDFTLPHGSAILQHTLGLPEEVACFDVNLGCSGYVYALSIAKGFAVSYNFSIGLLVTCDPYSKIMHTKDTAVLPLFGDASTATWLSAEDGLEILNFDFGTMGKRFDDLILRNGGTRNAVGGIYSTTSLKQEDWHLEMNGRGIFNFMMSQVPKTVEKCLRKNNLAADDIDHFLFHQASNFLVTQLIKHLKLEKHKVPINIAEIGNTVSSTLPILLEETMSKKETKNLNNLLLCGFGVGLSWASTVLRVRH